jgi:hypothetical protein
VLFVACNAAGQVQITFKFLIARAKDLVIANSAFLIELETTDVVPQFSKYSVCLPEDYSSVPKPLPPLTDNKMFHNLAFSVTEDSNMLISLEQLKETVEALGGLFWDQEEKNIARGKMSTRTKFNIGEHYTASKKPVSSEWIIDMVVRGGRLHHKAYEVKETLEDDAGQETYTQPIKKAKVWLGSYVLSSPYVPSSSPYVLSVCPLLSLCPLLMPYVGSYINLFLQFAGSSSSLDWAGPRNSLAPPQNMFPHPASLYPHPAASVYPPHPAMYSHPTMYPHQYYRPPY